MEIHFYENSHFINEGADSVSTTSDGYCLDYWSTHMALYNEVPVIITTQMCFLRTHLFELGYSIFVHRNNGSVYEIKLGNLNSCTDREIRMETNLFHLWESGEFNTKKRGFVSRCENCGESIYSDDTYAQVKLGTMTLDICDSCFEVVNDDGEYE